MGSALLAKTPSPASGSCDGLQEAKASAPTATSADLPPLSVQTVAEFSTFLTLQPLWNKLCEESEIDHPFLSYEWVRTWWECFGHGKQLHIVLVKAGADLIAAAPFMLSHRRMYGFTVRRLQLIYNAHCNRLGIIVARRPAEAYQAIWTSLVSLRPSWGILELAQLPETSDTSTHLRRLAETDGYLTGLWRGAASPYVSLRGTWDEYYASLDRKHRQNLRNRFKRLHQRGSVSVETVVAPGHLEPALEEGFRLEAAAWKGRAGTAICSNPAVREFYTQFAQRAADCGWLRLHFLTVGGRRIAFHYCLAYRNKLYLLKPGYDPEYACYSPSNLLCELVIRQAFEGGLTEYDFLGEKEEWKLEWTQNARPHVWLFVFPRLLHPRVLHYVKFHVIPRLQQWRCYPRLRDTLVRLITGAVARRFTRDTS